MSDEPESPQEGFYLPLAGTQEAMKAMQLSPAVAKMAEKLQYFKSVAAQMGVPWEKAQERLDKKLKELPVCTIYDCIDRVVEEIQRGE